MPRGGARPNSGPAKGTKYAPTIKKEEAREAIRQIVLREAETLVGAQIAHAKGIKYLVARNKKSGKWVRLTEELTHAIIAGTDTEHESLEVWTKDPSVQAFTDLLNRAIDKPKEQEQEIKVTHSVEVVTNRLNHARLRLVASHDQRRTG